MDKNRKSIKFRSVSILLSAVLVAGSLYAPVYAADTKEPADASAVVDEAYTSDTVDAPKTDETSDIAMPDDDTEIAETADIAEPDEDTEAAGSKEEKTAVTEDDPDAKADAVEASEEADADAPEETDPDVTEEELLDDPLDPYGYFVRSGYKITGVTDAGKNAVEIDIPEGIKEIGPGAFQHCKMSKVTLPASLQKVGGNAFTNCSYLSTVVINSTSFEVAGDGAFSKCIISSLTLPDGMTEIPKLLFSGAGFSNYDLVIGKNIKKIGEAAFNRATGIKSLTFEDGSCLETIGADAFHAVQTISTLALPVSLKRIEHDAFRDIAITEINIPKNVTFLGGNSFSENNLKKIFIHAPNVSTTKYSEPVFDNREFSDDGIGLLMLPNGMKTIPPKIFRYSRYKNAEIMIPNSVTTIEAYAFGNLFGTVKSFIFEEGSRVSRIGEKAFFFNLQDNKNVDTKFCVENGSYTEKWLRNEGFTNIFAPYDLGKTTVELLIGGEPVKKVPYTGSEIKPDVVVKKGNDIVPPEKYDVSYLNNTEAGIATVTVSAKADDNDYFGSKEVYFTITGVPITNSKNVTIECPKTAVWMGEGYETKPLLTLKNAQTGNVLEEGTDYTLIYSNNLKPGKASVTVIGKGGYDGSSVIAYTISKPDFKDASETLTDGIKCTITGADGLTYNGKAHTPDVAVTYKGTALKKGVDYTVKYANNINAYTLTKTDPGFNARKAPSITVTGKGIFTGSWVRNFTIVPFSLTSANTTVTIPAQKATGNPLAPIPVVTVTLEDGTEKVLKAGTDYVKPVKDDYKNNTEPSKGKTGDDRPYVAINTKAGANYSGSNIKGFFEIAPASNNIADAKQFLIGKVGQKEFTGRKLTLTDAEIASLVGVRKEKGSSELSGYLTYGTDYKLTYKNNLYAGKATVTIVGMGDYYGSKPLTFTIGKRVIEEQSDLEKLKITLNKKTEEPQYYYTGYAIKPKVTIVDPMGDGDEDDYTLVEGKDYTVKYKNNVNVSAPDRYGVMKKAAATVTFKGNYAGNRTNKTTIFTKNYLIKSWKLTDGVSTVFVKGDGTYNFGKPVKETVKVMVEYDGDFTLVNPKSYFVTYENNINPGPSKIIINPAKNSGITESFSINSWVKKGDLANAVITPVKPQVYKGGTVTPKLTVKYKGKKLIENKHYKVYFENNNKKGLGKYTIKWFGDYFEGEQTGYFVIK